MELAKEKNLLFQKESHVQQMCLFHQTKEKKYGNIAPYGPAARGKTHIGGMFHQTKGKKHEDTAPYGSAARGKTHIGGNSLGTCTQGTTSPPAIG